VYEPRPTELVDITSGPCPWYKEPLCTFPDIVIPGITVLDLAGVGTGGEASAVSVGTMLQGQGRCTCQSAVPR
jgi:hypothetical protein